MVDRGAEEGDDGTTAPLVAPAPPRFLDYSTFYRRELPQLVALAGAIAGWPAAEEIAQEALLRAHREWVRVEQYDKPGAWVRRVTINLATSARRRRVSEARALLRLAQRPLRDMPPPEVDEFWALVRKLPPQQAAAVALHYLEDRSIADLAVILDCAEGTAKAHLHKARRTLAHHLTHEEPDR